MGVRSSHLTLITGILWLTLPLTLGDLLADAAPADTPVEVAEKLRWRGLLRFMKRAG